MILDNNTTINGIAYDWSSISFKYDAGSPADLLNTNITQITAISYGETRDAQKNYGAGSYPVSKGYGNVDVKATMTISMFELRKLINAATNQKIQNLGSFDIQIAYFPGNSNVAVVTDTINGCTIDSTFFDLKQNDMDVQVDINLNPMNVTYGQTA